MYMSVCECECVYIRLYECLPKDNVVWKRGVGREGAWNALAALTVFAKSCLILIICIFFFLL